MLFPLSAAAGALALAKLHWKYFLVQQVSLDKTELELFD